MKVIAASLALVTAVMAAVPASQPTTADSGAPWWRELASADPVPAALRAAGDALAESVTNISVEAAVAAQEIRDRASEALERLRRHRGDDEAGKKPRLTLYQTLQGLEGASKFAELVDGLPELVDALNGTDSDKKYTLLVPRDEAFDKIPDKYKKPDRETLEFVLKYHVVAGQKKAHDVLTSYTLESEAVESRLGGEKQRIRVGAGFTGVNFNGYSKVTAVNIDATNGVIHVISDVLVPPPPVGVIITLFPAHFSSLLLAYERTDFIPFIHSQHILGSTVIAPSNLAFERLGVAANAFLFNTDKGRKYLKAIIKYSIVPNATVYTDAFYDKRGGSSSVETASQEHYSLDTFLPGASISLDVASLFGFRCIKVNGFTTVTIRDGIGSNGVLHVVEKVVLPPRHGRHEDADADADAAGEMSVEEIKERLDPYVEAEDDEDELISGDL